MVDSEYECIPVGVAEYAVTGETRPLKTSGVGSCVAVALHDPDHEVSGLLHFMLPESDSRDRPEPDAKFADTGLEAMLDEFEREGGVADRSWAKLVGGATMIEFSGAGGSIGDQNVAAAKALLEAHGIPVRAVEVGGSAGRSITFDPTNGEVVVRTAGGTVIRK
ncbi:chemotaxis protein CheD [Halopiger aswanensis]|uniref:Probable chemoreceptor glutamine deamidase CheD n=1 Tax=Halopiger aswanensis TaxID=148449 RepID=A0A419WSE4_9EURY|nr:chemotaxis protein CheD [Halopiger aswanensis]RKD98335.1 chemotaxis protein CheD [Halopiger aswanensis]